MVTLATRISCWRVPSGGGEAEITAALKATEIATTEDGSLSHQRLIQMHEFYNFLLEEIPAVLDRWLQRAPATETQI